LNKLHFTFFVEWDVKPYYTTVEILRQFEQSYLQKKRLWPLVILILGQGRSKCNRLVPGLCPAITYNFIKALISTYWVILLTDRQTHVKM